MVRTPEENVAVDVECAYCGHAATALVRAKGTGTATSFILLDRDSARQAALDEAVEDMAHQAQVTAALLPCSRCHRRSRSALVQFVTMTVLGVLLLVVFAVVAWWITDPGFGHWLAPGSLLFSAGVLGISKRKRLREVDSLLVDVRVRPVLPAATVVKGGTGALVPIESKAPEREPTNDGPEPKLLQ